MFEEVPRDRRGMARLLPVRRVVLGPFVFGGGMLLAALGGSVAVAAAAATMITASAIGSDVPARPGHPAFSAASSTHPTLSARRPPVHHQAVRPPTATAVGLVPGSTQSGPASPTQVAAPSSTSVAPPPPVRTATVRPPAGPAATSTTPPSSAAGPPLTPSPSSSAPAGNAVIHVSGYHHGSKRLAYQFASVQQGGGVDGGDLYRILDADTFTAALAPSIAITSGGSICPPAGSTCTVDQLIDAADPGFFAVVAIDARGELRSVLEIGEQSATPKLAPAPSATPAASSSRPGGTSPAPSPSANS